jgi:glycosyltransferase involved in cell wall biosynthesis
MSSIDDLFRDSISATLLSVGESFNDELIIWCNSKYRDYINFEELDSIFHHKCMMVSFTKNDKFYITPEIGYVDQSIYLKVNPNFRFPTWLMNSDIGGIHGSVLKLIGPQFNNFTDFDFLLNSISKVCQPLGLFCYSDPKLLKSNAPKLAKKTIISKTALFRFVKSYYKSNWSYFLFFCYIIYQKKFPFLAFFKTFFYKIKSFKIDLSYVQIESTLDLIDDEKVDVIIPTIGRKGYLYNVLDDLSKQTILPQVVIIVEQNPDSNSESDLDYLTNQDWPFRIEHFFIHKTGVCNARNLALRSVKSNWVILGDDDNRFGPKLIEQFLNSVKKYGVKAVSSTYLQPGESQLFKVPTQTSIFGSGNSIIKTEMLDKIGFDIAFEFGYGEDRDFGMQIRNIGEDVLFDANISITHLKAPMGGFRTKIEQIWNDSSIQPKPSPTISLFNKKHLMESQLLGYKLLLFLTYYHNQKIKNPFNYFNRFQNQWKSSLYWANQLANKHD